MYDFKKIEFTNNKLKALLENKFDVIYIVQRVVSTDENIKNEDSNYLHLFEIAKNKESIFDKITSPDILNQVKKEIENYYVCFINDFNSYFDRVESQLNDKNIESFEIIAKTLSNRKKKLDAKLKRFNIEDDWNIAKIRDELIFALRPIFQDIIESILNPIMVGLKESNSYEGVVIEFNKFLSLLGFYTQSFSVGHILQDHEWDLIKPESCDECKTDDKSKKDMIKEILTQQYLTSSEDIILPSKIYLWRV